MSQAEWFTTYLEYENLKDMLKVILYTSQSFMSITPLLYYINFQDRDIFFIHTGIVGGVVAHYHLLREKPSKKFIELNKLTGEFEYAENIGSNTHSIYIPIIALTRSTLRFPMD
jgi:arginine deiminase